MNEWYYSTKNKNHDSTTLSGFSSCLPKYYTIDNFGSLTMVRQCTGVCIVPMPPSTGIVYVGWSELHSINEMKLFPATARDSWSILQPIPPNSAARRNVPGSATNENVRTGTGGFWGSSKQTTSFLSFLSKIVLEICSFLHFPIDYLMVESYDYDRLWMLFVARICEYQ